MYSYTNAHFFYLIFGLPLLWHTKMKATKVLLYNKHHRKKKRVNCTFIEEYTAKRATVFFFLMGLNCTQPCSLTLFMSNAKVVLTINDTCGDGRSQCSPFVEVTIPSALKANEMKYNNLAILFYINLSF